MSSAIFRAANQCIYCGSIEGPLSSEHIIPFSFGGKFELPEASCAACARLTSLHELRVAREAYYMARAAFGTASRRKRSFPSTVLVTLKSGRFGPTETIAVPIENAPISIIIPNFTRRSAAGNRLISTCNFEAHHIPNDREVDARVQKLLKKYKAKSVDFESGGMNANNFVSVLWKIATGFFWISDRESLLASNAARFANGDVSCTAEPVPSGSRSLMSFVDLFSVARPPRSYVDARSAVFSISDEDHAFLYCAIDIFARFGLPIYYCRIANVHRHQLHPHFYGRDEEMELVRSIR